MTRKIVYISGTRADFGLMRSTLKRIQGTTEIDLSIVLTGMHLSPEFGETWKEVVSENLPVVEKIAINMHPSTGPTMAKALGNLIVELTTVFTKIKPDCILLLGDRGEMLAAAIAALHLNIPVAHIHGGERSGTIDESIRHAVSKLSHIHFAATEASRNRLIQLGEQPEMVFVSGAPGLDEIVHLSVQSRMETFGKYGFDINKPVGLLLFHPVVQESASASQQVAEVLAGLELANWQGLALMPNADAGSDEIRKAYLERLPKGFIPLVHLERRDFIQFMANCDAMIGNSSSGIIEAGTFGTPVINIGSRQNLRERNANVFDVGADSKTIFEHLENILNIGRFPPGNLYGDGKAANKIVEVLKGAKLEAALLNKVFVDR